MNRKQLVAVLLAGAMLFLAGMGAGYFGYQALHGDKADDAGKETSPQ